MPEMENSPTHWTQFNTLYDLEDPRPYFLGVAGGDYRMPWIIAQVLTALHPVLAERSPHSVPRLLDFACGYGAVGLCLRTGMDMARLTQYFQNPVRDPLAEDRAYFLGCREKQDFSFHITGVDVASTAVRYAKGIGAIDAGTAANILETPDALASEVPEIDLFFECGAIGDLVPDAAEAFLSQRNLGARHQPWILVSPRPRVPVKPLERVLEAHGYRMETVLEKVRYRLPFSQDELTEEMEAGVRNGLKPEECLVDGYFRVDLRLAIPVESDSAAAHQAVGELFSSDH